MATAHFGFDSVHRAIQLGVVLAGCMVSFAARAGLPLETETARLAPQGHGYVSAAFEYQTSADGKEIAVPLLFEYGISDRLELTVEPVAYTSIRPSDGPSASGFGDTEAALTFLVARETGAWPAFAIAGEVKFPTTHNSLIGTGKADYRVYGILSKQFGNFDLHANLGYTFVGSPSDQPLNNVVDYAVALEYAANERLTLVMEVVGNTSSGGSDAAGAVNPEAVGNEVVGLVGFAYQANPWLALSCGVTYDNNRAFLVRPGLTVRF